jgi:hypothetical protein
VQPTLFAVGDEPYCLWEDDVAERTKDFIDGLDPDFFEYLLKVNTESEDEKRASVAIRLALHHGVETLFSLLGAFVQAPKCPYAWISQCRTEELRKVVRRIGEGDPALLTHWRDSFTGWESVARQVMSVYGQDDDKRREAVSGFARLWGALAGELTDEVTNLEYNAIKHGFRTRAGGFRLEMGREETPGVPAPASAMQLLGESDFGAMFYRVERFKEGGGRHLQSRRTAVNWSIERDVLLLQMVHCSINNVITAFKVAHGAPAGSCKYLTAAHPDDYMRAWSHSPGVLSINIDFALEPNSLPVLSKDDLLAKMRKAQSRGVPPT